MWQSFTGGASYGLVLPSPSVDTAPASFLAGQVHPDFQRRGIGRALMTWEIDRALEDRKGRPGTAEVTAPEGSAAHRLACNLGLQEKRRWRQLHRTVPQNSLQVLMPHRVRVARGDEVDHDPLREHRNRCFHHGPYLDASAWAEFTRGSDLRWDLSRVAYEESGELVGAIYVRVAPGHDAYIDSLVVSPEWRRRGVATALLRSTLGALQDQGIPGVALDVNTSNTSGAASLYEREGFRQTGALVTLALTW